MKTMMAYAAGILAALLSTSSTLTPVQAASLTNRDTRSYEVTILEKGQAGATRPLDSGQVLEGICGKGCIVRLDGSERAEYLIEGDDLLSISGGEIYLDGSAQADPSSSADQPAAGATRPKTR